MYLTEESLNKFILEMKHQICSCGERALIGRGILGFSVRML